MSKQDGADHVLAPVAKRSRLGIAMFAESFGDMPLSGCAAVVGKDTPTVLLAKWSVSSSDCQTLLDGWPVLRHTQQLATVFRGHAE